MKRQQHSIFRRILGVAALGLGLACSANAPAQAPAAECRADVAKFCAQVQAGEGRVARCLKESQWQLSAACQQHVDLVAARTKETLQACQDEILQFCSSGEVEGRGIAQCLKRENPRLSPECRALAKLLQKN
jgi:hypothetical protein